MNIIDILEKLDLRHSDGHTFTYQGKRYPVPYQTLTVAGVRVDGLRDVDDRIALINKYSAHVMPLAYLDIGCNLGMVTAGVGARFDSAWGIDTDEHYIDICRELHTGEQYEFEACDVERLLVPMRFNLITALSMIENVIDPNLWMSVVYRKVAPAGVLILEGHSSDIVTGKWRVWDALMRSHDWAVELLKERTNAGENSPHAEGRPVWVCQKE
jgi:SAM-dependent methyltransferase